MGGGNGSAKSIRALKLYKDEFDVTGVISVSDSGGSSGVLREEFNTLPTGDVLRAILAMSKHDYSLLKSIFYKPRFSEEGNLKGHNIGNIFLVLAEKYTGDRMKAIRALEEALGACGHVYPVTQELTHLCARMSDDSVIEGEHLLDRPEFDRSKRIREVWLAPEVKVDAAAKKAILEADYIVLGPGSLYCSVIPTLLPTGVSEAIKASKAKIIYACGNAYEADGETGAQTLSEFVQGLQKYLPRKIDTVVHNNHEMSDEQKQWYAEKRWTVFNVDAENIDVPLIQGDYELEEEAGLDADKLGAILKTLLV